MVDSNLEKLKSEKQSLEEKLNDIIEKFYHEVFPGIDLYFDNEKKKNIFFWKKIFGVNCMREYVDNSLTGDLSIIREELKEQLEKEKERLREALLKNKYDNIILLWIKIGENDLSDLNTQYKKIKFELRNTINEIKKIENIEKFSETHEKEEIEEISSFEMVKNRIVKNPLTCFFFTLWLLLCIFVIISLYKMWKYRKNKKRY